MNLNVKSVDSDIQEHPTLCHTYGIYAENYKIPGFESSSLHLIVMNTTGPRNKYTSWPYLILRLRSLLYHPAGSCLHVYPNITLVYGWDAPNNRTGTITEAFDDSGHVISQQIYLSQLQLNSLIIALILCIFNRSLIQLYTSVSMK